MEQTKWCCVNYKFGSNGVPMILPESVRYKRTESIAWFIDGTNNTWRYWKEKIGWQCIKVKVTIEVI